MAIDGRGGRTRRNRSDRNHGSLREWIARLVRQQVGGTATDGAETAARPGHNGRECAARPERRQWNPPITPPRKPIRPRRSARWATSTDDARPSANRNHPRTKHTGGTCVTSRSDNRARSLCSKHQSAGRGPAKQLPTPPTAGSPPPSSVSRQLNLPPGSNRFNTSGCGSSRNGYRATAFAAGHNSRANDAGSLPTNNLAASNPVPPPAAPLEPAASAPVAGDVPFRA